jgi:hypothetical protein
MYLNNRNLFGSHRSLLKEPVNSGKKRKKTEEEEVEVYEQRPRKLVANDDNVKSLLPIKTKTGVIPRTAHISQEGR